MKNKTVKYKIYRDGIAFATRSITAAANGDFYSTVEDRINKDYVDVNEFATFNHAGRTATIHINTERY